MNERIKLLAEQAGLMSAKPTNWNSRVLLATKPGTDGEIADPDEQLAVFAELIVCECAKHAEHAKGTDVNFETYFKAMIFGVEE